MTALEEFTRCYIILLGLAAAAGSTHHNDHRSAVSEIYEYVTTMEPSKWVLRGMTLVDLCALNDLGMAEVVVCAVWRHFHWVFFSVVVVPMVSMGVLVSLQVRCFYTDMFTGLWEHRFREDATNYRPGATSRRSSRSSSRRSSRERSPRDHKDLRSPSPPAAHTPHHRNLLQRTNETLLAAAARLRARKPSPTNLR